MSLSGHDGRRRSAQRRLTLAAVLAGALAASAVVAAVGLGSGSRSSSAAHPGPQLSQATVHGAPAPRAASATGAGPIPLPAPDHVVSGIPVGYPDTAQGAVSCAAHYFEALDLFDPGAAQLQARVIAQPGFGDAFALQAKTAAEALRTAAGLTATGTSDNANYAARQARSYRIADATAARVALWLLMDDTTSAKGLVSSSTHVQGAVMVWSQGDWHMAVGQRVGTRAPQPVTPNSPEADREGWRTIAYGK